MVFETNYSCVNEAIESFLPILSLSSVVTWDRKSQVRSQVATSDLNLKSSWRTFSASTSQATAFTSRIALVVSRYLSSMMWSSNQFSILLK